MPNKDMKANRTPEGVIYFQLRFLYRLLYGKASHRDASPCVLQRSDLIDPNTDLATEENPLQRFLLRPAYKRFLVPAYAGKLELLSLDEDDIVAKASKVPESLLSVKTNLDFVKLHFFPLYDQWKEYIDDADKAYNLQDIMGRKQVSEGKTLLKRRNRDSDNGAGASLKEKLLRFVLDNNALGLQMLRSTQANILSAYSYSPVKLRETSVYFFNEAKKNEDPENRFIKDGILDQIEVLVMDFFSRCCDDVALTTLLVAAVLRERMESVLPIIASHPCMKTITFTDAFKQERIGLGDEYYMIAQRHSNYMGGTRLSDMTLYKRPNQFVRKITDYLGCFFTDPKIENPEWNRNEMKQIKFNSAVYPFRDGIALFMWVYQPDGRYWEDDADFGRTNDDEIILYSLMNTSGDFIQPFSTTRPSGW